ncbi:MAG: LacI family DNA-binding transcriptional regulator [Thermaerobacter sp.]|nr:LacI family DNA-binding transcriptional regulator [Thermaerobacter sp.]
MVTLSDVAKRAGVSASTVSRVVNNNGYVSKAIAKRVMDAVAELDYRPNVVARSFRSQTTMTIGVVVSDLTNSYFMDALQGIEEILSTEGYLLLIASSYNVVSKELQYCLEFDRRRVDGTILASAGASQAELAKVFRERAKVVLIDRLVEGAPFDCVLDDNDAGVQQLVDYLLDMGHRNFGVVSGPAAITAGLERVAAFESQLHTAGYAVPSQWKWLVPVFSDEYGYQVGQILADMPERPTALFCANNALAQGLLMALADRGISVPDDISVVSYGTLANGRLFRTTITAIEQPARQTGRVAAELLLARMCDNDTPYEVVRMPATLSLGNSVQKIGSFYTSR